MKNNLNVYDWLNIVQNRPEMYMGDANDLTTLETLIWGYYIALNQHGIVEKGPKFEIHHFNRWLHEKTGIGGALGWANLLNEKYPDPKVAAEKFWEYIEEYKNLEPQDGS